MGSFVANKEKAKEKSRILEYTLASKSKQYFRAPVKWRLHVFIPSLEAARLLFLYKIKCSAKWATISVKSDTGSIKCEDTIYLQ